MKSYVVTDAAPEWVAGRRVKPGDVLTLSDNQAAYEVARGLLRLVRPAAAAAAQATKHKKSRRGR